MPRPRNGGLTNRQARFVEEYLKDCYAKEASIRAGYARRRAKQQGWTLLRHPKDKNLLVKLRVASTEMRGQDVPTRGREGRGSGCFGDVRREAWGRETSAATRQRNDYNAGGTAN